MKTLSVLLFTFALIGSNLVLAQVTGSISGIVQDTSGAAVPNATVTVRSLETGATRTILTGDIGSYRALSLPVGQYEIRAEKEGFKTAVRTGIDLVVGQAAAVNLNLEVGAARQEVTVMSEAPLVDTSTTPAS